MTKLQLIFLEQDYLWKEMEYITQTIKGLDKRLSTEARKALKSEYSELNYKYENIEETVDKMLGLR